MFCDLAIFDSEQLINGRGLPPRFTFRLRQLSKFTLITAAI
jgi:hypothetical protein